MTYRQTTSLLKSVTQTSSADVARWPPSALVLGIWTGGRNVAVVTSNRISVGSFDAT
jgi:hypothetical protein